MSTDTTLATRPATLSADLSSATDQAVDRTVDWLLQEQDAEGFWCAELEGDTILESEYLLLLAFLEREAHPIVEPACRYMLDKQLESGGWAQYPGGQIDVSISVKNYFALKIAGYPADREPMQRACAAIRAAGGADKVNSFTRFYLALLGQIPYELCPAVPPEMVLLPNWAPLNIYRMSSWSRTIFVPLSIMWAHRPCRDLPQELGIRELYLREPEEWPPLRSPGTCGPRKWLSWESFFYQVDRVLKFAERNRVRPLRSRSLRAAQAWMLERFEGSDGLGAIFPPIIWSIVALKCLGYREEDSEIQSCLQELEALTIQEEGTARLQPCKSPVWDTALTLRALAAAGRTRSRDAVERAIGWLLDKEVRQKGDWAIRVDAEPGGWFFEHRNVFYPDIDDTIMVMMGLHECQAELFTEESAAALSQGIQEATARALQWTMALQNRDGGWGAFDRDNDQEILCHVPFADHNAMIDPSTPDISARVLEALACFDIDQEDPRVARTLDYLFENQEQDGSWYGRWGVNYIYGTWQTIVGLRAAGIDPQHPAIQRGVEWLLAHQQDSGGWGESADSYFDDTARGRGPATASQTAWALLGLLAADCQDQEALEAGIRYLVTTQNAAGDWEETEFTGTGFPQVFYLRYHYYRIYFPLQALAGWRAQRSSRIG